MAKEGYNSEELALVKELEALPDVISDQEIKTIGNDRWGFVVGFGQTIESITAFLATIQHPVEAIRHHSQPQEPIQSDQPSRLAMKSSAFQGPIEAVLSQQPRSRQAQKPGYKQRS